jgi:dTDP-4-amino-4,6-dideoxygalactose transaminase
MDELGYNYRITDLQCALGISQLNRLNVFKDHRAKIVKSYNEQLSKLKHIQIPPLLEHEDAFFHLYVSQLLGGEAQRLLAYRRLLEKGYRTQVHYIPIYRQPYYQKKYAFQLADFPHSERYYSRCLSLPLHYEINLEHVEEIVQILKGVEPGDD